MTAYPRLALGLLARFALSISFHHQPSPRLHHFPPPHSVIMADVDMADAPPAKTKTGKAGASGEGDKKRFEVKKVGGTRR